MKKKKAIALAISLSLLFPAIAPLNPQAAMKDEIQAMIDQGIMQGYQDGDFRPHQSVTRAEFATFLTRALDLPSGPSVFKDVSPSLKLSAGINAAAAAKIVNGGSDGRFHPDDLITRKDMALMISNALDYLKMDVKYTAAPFTDIKDLSSAHKVAIGKNYVLNIIRGYSATTFNPMENARRDHAAAFIYRLLEAKKTSGSTEPDPSPEPTPPPVPTPDPPKEEPTPSPTGAYQVATIDASGKLTYASGSYSTFAAAKQVMEQRGQELVLKNKKIIYMPTNGGMVFAGNSGATVNLYSEPGFVTARSYAVKGAELKYITSTDSYVKASLGGRDYYMKHSDSTLVPFEGASGRSYYRVSNGELQHFMYQPGSKSPVSYVAGKAPSFLNANQKYYSWDNATFYNDQGRVVGTAYQYFQFLSARTTTNYTAAQLDSYIKKALAERQATGLAKYKDATKKSKLIGLGATLKKVEAEKRINALLVLAMAIHESDYGMSRHAQVNNNLFGIAVYDSKPEEGKSFPSPVASVNHLADGYLNDRYVVPNPVGAWKQSVSNGAAAGNKGVGINVKYASDIAWGGKVAGHMYRIDQALGKKDFGKYQIGLTNVEGLNVRSTPNGAIQFKYREAGMPVVMIGAPASGWQKIISDELRYKEAYVFSQYVTPLPIAK
ncbi:S-layer homology domain-containing protein [Pseudobacillus sp. FSL P4-0506]|uniref:S-layer homology domain-containing protein n=1 Tax=unclassified Pseudobacillus TaxID=2619284 RepID=UPI0030F589B2